MNAQDKLDQQLLYSESFKNIQHWLSLGANINVQDDSGNSLLHIWVLRKKTSELEKLVKTGIKMDMTNNEGQTPLHCITMWHRYIAPPEEGLIKRIKILLENGADPAKQDGRGHTFLDGLDHETKDQLRALMAEVAKQAMDKIIPKIKRTTLEPPCKLLKL